MEDFLSALTSGDGLCVLKRRSGWKRRRCAGVVSSVKERRDGVYGFVAMYLERMRSREISLKVRTGAGFRLTDAIRTGSMWSDTPSVVDADKIERWLFGVGAWMNTGGEMLRTGETSTARGEDLASSYARPSGITTPFA